MGRRYCFEAVLEAVPARGGAYVRFPYDLRQEFGRGRVRVQADFDGVPYRGSLVYMGVFRGGRDALPHSGGAEGHPGAAGQTARGHRDRHPGGSGGINNSPPLNSLSGGLYIYRSVRGLALISQKWSSWREQARKISRHACWRSGLRSRQTRSVKRHQVSQAAS